MIPLETFELVVGTGIAAMMATQAWVLKELYQMRVSLASQNADNAARIGALETRTQDHETRIRHLEVKRV